jgi:hypothetical protein
MMIQECPMSDKDLQQVTECVSDIGQGSMRRRPLPARCHQLTQKVKVAGPCTLYISASVDTCWFNTVTGKNWSIRLSKADFLRHPDEKWILVERR